MTSVSTNISLIKRWILRALIAASVVEIVFFPALENMYGCFVSIYAWILLSKIALSNRNFEKALLPTCAVFGYVFCYFVLPIFVTLIEGKPLTFNFSVPFLMFSNQIINVTTILMAYVFTLKIYDQRNCLTTIWKRIGYFDVPDEKVIWILGFIGTICLCLNIGKQGDVGELQASSSLFNQIMYFIQGFAVFPLCLLFQNFLGRQQSFSSKKFVKYYIVILSIIGIATTRRALVFNSLATIGFLYLLSAIIENRRIFSVKSVIISLISIFFILGPFADLATAMILNRKVISSSSDTFNNVVDLYKDKETLRILYNYSLLDKDNGGDNSKGWSEYYVNNIFLDRFCNIRVQDATLYYAQKIGYANSIMTSYFYENFINHLPGIIVRFLGESKTVLTTPVDHMVGSRWSNASIGSWRVGGDTGIGLATMGYLYYPFAFIIYVLVFYFFCSCVVYKGTGTLFIVPLPLLSTMMWYFTYFDNAFGIYRSINLLMSQSLRNIVMYCVFIVFFNRFLGPFLKKRRYTT